MRTTPSNPSAAAEFCVQMENVAVPASRDPSQLALSDVHWTVRPGEFWVVGGLPGSGKSALLATAAGLNPPVSGRCRLFDRDWAALADEEQLALRQHVGWVDGSVGRLFHQLTVAENLALPIRYHRTSSSAEVEARVAALLEAFELGEWAETNPGWMPRNLRPRVSLARALALAPSLILIDDALQGLDPTQARWWLQFLSALHRGHELLGGHRATLIVAVDDLRWWTAHGERFAVIDEGRWLDMGVRGQKHEAPSSSVWHQLAAGGLSK